MCIRDRYINAVPLYRQEQEFQRMGVNIDRADMARWTILCAERYLSLFYDYLHEKLYESHVLQADETPVLVSKEDRTTGTKHYMLSLIHISTALNRCRKNQKIERT